MQETSDVQKPSQPDVKQAVNLVDKIHSVLVKNACQTASIFLGLPSVKEAVGQSVERQRVLINRDLRLVLGSKEEDTSIARLALDDSCVISEYLSNFKRYVVEKL